MNFLSSSSLRVSLVAALLAGGAVAASASALPVGFYVVNAHTTTTGVHQSPDQGILSGFVVFNSASQLTSANLTFTDTTSMMTFTYTNIVGSSSIPPPGTNLLATINNATNPLETFSFGIRLPGLPDGTFNLNCQTDCDDNFEITDNGGRTYTYEEVQGNITPTPEPSSLLLLGTGALAAAGAVRRRLSR